MRATSALAPVIGLVLATAPSDSVARGGQDVRPAGAVGVLTRPGELVPGRLAPGTAIEYEVPAAPRTFVRVIVEGHGMQVRVSLRAPGVADGTTPLRTRTGGDRTPVVWSVVTDAGGAAVVRIESAEPSDSRPYSVRLAEQRAAVIADTPRLAAEQLLESTASDSAGDARRALDAADNSGDAALQVRALLRLAAADADAGRSAEAERAIVDARDRCRTLPGAACAYDVELALGRLLSSTGRPEPGLAAFEAARAAAEAAGDRAALADALAERGGVEIALTRQERARTTLTNAVEVARAAGHRRAEADASNMLGILLANLGEPEQSEQHYDAALRLRRAIGDKVGTAQTVSNLGALANSVGEYRRALGYFDEALAARRRLGLAQATANTLHNLGVAHANLGGLETALGHLEEALAIWQRTGGRRGEAFALQELGQTYARLGDRRRALEHWRRARPSWRALGDRRGEAQTVLFAAAVEAEADLRTEAAASYTVALDLARSAQLRREEGMALLGLAGLARQRGEIDGALGLAQQALALFDAIGNRRERGRALAELGAVYVAADRLPEGRAALHDALEALEAVEDGAEAGRVGLALADAVGRTGDGAAALGHIRRALDHVEAVRREQHAESLNLSVFASDRPLYDRALAVLMRLHRQAPTAGFDAHAFHVSERRRARRLLDMVAAPIGEGDDAGEAAGQLRAIEERIAAKATRLTRMLSDAAPVPARVDRARDELRGLVERADRLRADLRRAHRATLSDPVVLDWPALQARLGPDAVLLEFAIGDDDGVGWAVTATTLQGFAVPGRRRLEPLVRQFTESVSRGPLGPAASSGAAASPAERPVARLGQTLSTALFGPAISALAHGRRIVFVGDGVLDGLPIAALPPPDGPGVLGDRYQIDIVPSASVAAALQARRRDRPSAPPRIAVFADPVYSRGDGRLPADRRASPPAVPDLLRLRFSREEARAIERLAPGRTTLLLDFAATRQRTLDRSLAGYRYLHWASHARIDDAVPQLSTIDLSRVDAAGRPIDGAVRLLDVYGLSLNADLVVLSACRTALGAPVAGEGLVGFASGFLRTGADRVLASLWDVDDRAAAAFMTRFYTGLLTARLSPEAALSAAQRQMRRDPAWRHSSDWAAWVLIGPGGLTPPVAGASGPAPLR